MRGATIHAPGDIRLETLDDPKILHPTDAVIRTAVARPTVQRPGHARGHRWRVWGGALAEAAGTAQAMQQALHSVRPSGNVGFIGVPHDAAVGGQELFFSRVGLRGGPVPVRRYLPGRIDPGKVFDLTLPLEPVAEGYRAMDERRATKTFSKP
nr:hypothetical protein [Actinocorallia populi]